MVVSGTGNRTRHLLLVSRACFLIAVELPVRLIEAQRPHPNRRRNKRPRDGKISSLPDGARFECARVVPASPINPNSAAPVEIGPAPVGIGTPHLPRTESRSPPFLSRLELRDCPPEARAKPSEAQTSRIRFLLPF